MSIHPERTPMAIPHKRTPLFPLTILPRPVRTMPIRGKAEVPYHSCARFSPPRASRFQSPPYSSHSSSPPPCCLSIANDCELQCFQCSYQSAVGSERMVCLGLWHRLQISSCIPASREAGFTRVLHFLQGYGQVHKAGSCHGNKVVESR